MPSQPKHYVILRDDDTNALTPVEFLEELYRPFLARKLPVNLAVIPEVRTTVTLPDGRPEGFLLGRSATTPELLPVDRNKDLLKYLHHNPGFRIIHHGHHHDYFEFDRTPAAELKARLENGTAILERAGFHRPETFVAPYDKISRPAYRELARRFQVISTGWFEWRRLPAGWLPAYGAKKLLRRPHWNAGGLRLLSHPGCLLSCHHDYGRMFETIRQAVESSRLTVLVTHWWEYFRDGGKPDRAFIEILHRTADWLAASPHIEVVAFSDLVHPGRRGQAIPLS